LADSERVREVYPGSRRELFVKRFGRQIEDYEAFKRATTGLSQGTINNYSDRLPQFFMFIQEDPDSVIENRAKDIASTDVMQVERYERKVKNFLRMLENKNVSAKSMVGVIQGFFVNNSKRLRLDLGNLKLSKGGRKKKYSPSQADVQRLVGFADCARDRLIVALGFQHGLLPVDMTLLRIGEYPVVAWTYFTGKRSKTGEVYHAVSTPDTCKYLGDYLKLRGGKVGEALFVGRKGVLDAAAIRDVLELLIERSKLSEIPGFVPKCLRDGFADVLIDADVYLQVKEALMGHCSNIYHQYGSQKKVEERCVEAMKKAFPLLCLTENALVSESGDVAMLLKEFARLLPDIKELSAQKAQDEADKKLV
jgi:integrase